MITSLFSIQFIVLAIFINMIVFFIYTNIKGLMVKGTYPVPNFGIPKILIRNIMMSIVFIVAFGSTWALSSFGQIVLLNKSIFLTSAWSAIISIITYNIGVKELLNAVKMMLMKHLKVPEKKNNSESKKDIKYD